MKIYLLLLVSLLALTCPTAVAQTPTGFNIALQDGSQIQVPPASYPAGSVQTGTWNRIVSTAVTPLVDVNNNPTPVTIGSTSWSFGPYGHYDLPATFGDDALLLDSGFLATDPGMTLSLSGLAAGDYVLYSYFTVWGFSAGSWMDVQGVWIDFPSNGSGFGGEFVEGSTHLIHNINVQPGQTINVNVGILLGEDPIRFHGFQIIPVDALHKVHFCDSQVNSTGSEANMIFGGSSSVQADDLQLGADNLPPNQFGYFLVSWDPGIGIIPPGSQGNLCVGGNIGRHNRAGEVLFSGTNGSVLMDVSLTDIPQPTGPISIMPGEYWHWQYWYRDTNPSNTSNFSDAYRIGFTN